MVHDSARPFISKRIISQCIESLDEFEGAAPVMDPNDSLIKIEKGIAGHIERNKIKAVQTPQAFRLDILKTAQKSDLHTTDEIGLVYMHKPDVNIHFFKGDSYNFKVTTRTDLYLAEQIMRTNHSMCKSEFDASGKKVLVLGGSSGIGKAIADRLADFGADVTAVGSEIKMENPDSLKIFENKNWDIIVHSVGTMQVNNRSIIEKIEDLNYSEWDTGVKINLTSAFLTARLALKTMIKNGGHILFIGSSSAKKGRATFGLYSAAKAGLVNFSQSLSEEFSQYNIMVNCINPSRTLTKMRTVFTGEDNNKMLTPKRVAEISTSYCHGNFSGQVYDLRVGE